MYTIQVDLDVSFDPPMDTQSPGIELTRRIQLPFPPYDGLGICGKRISQGPGDQSLFLHEVVWDADRGLFTAESQSSNSGLIDLEVIRLDITGWVKRGWVWGSSMLKHREEQWGCREFRVEGKAGEIDQVDDPVLAALIRTMAANSNNWGRAFAMHRTGVLGTNKDLGHPNSTLAKRWKAAQEEWEAMDREQQHDWAKRVVHSYVDWPKAIETK